MDEPSSVRGLFQQGLLSAEPSVQRHDVALADRIDRRIRHLGELLLEVGVERTRRVVEDRQRCVIAHRANRLFGLTRHRLQDVLDFFLAVTVQDLAREQLALIGLGNARGLDAGGTFQPTHVLSDPAAVGQARSDAMLDVVVAQNLVTLGVDRHHLARSQAAGFDDLRLVDWNQADLGTHHDQAAPGDLVASGPQAVAVHRRGGDLSVGKGHRSGPVPRLSQTCVVLVEAAQVGIHVVEVFPGLGNQHHHRVQRSATGRDQQLEGFVERLGVGADGPQHRMQLRHRIAPDV